MSPAEEFILLPTSKLLPGMFVDLEMHWTKHPFAFSRFVIRSQKQIETIRSLKSGNVRVYPGRSELKKPIEELLRDGPGGDDAGDAGDSRATAEDREQQRQRERAEQMRRRRIEVGRDYREKVDKIQRITRDMRQNPANAIQDVDTLVDELARQFEIGDNLLTRLVELGSSDYNDYNHVANVTMLALMLASAEGVEGEALRRLAVGAVLHDIGKVALPAVVLSKRGKLTAAEQKVIEEHPRIGRKLAERVRPLHPEVRDIIEQHHEYLDGSGYPQGLGGEQIGPLVRMVSIANHYDNLCHPQDPSTRLAPKDALAHLYRNFGSRLDRRLVARLVSILGVYPPGTVVRLSDERLARVIASRPDARMAPDVIVFDPGIDRDNATILQLSDAPALEIREALRPGEYPSSIEDYFGISDQIGFMVDSEFDAPTA